MEYIREQRLWKSISISALLLSEYIGQQLWLVEENMTMTKELDWILLYPHSTGCYGCDFSANRKYIFKQKWIAAEFTKK